MSKRESVKLTLRIDRYGGHGMLWDPYRKVGDAEYEVELEHLVDALAAHLRSVQWPETETP